MTTEEQMPDGTWRTACPEPFWVGWRLRVAQCDCGKKFRPRRGERDSARRWYRIHWYADHPESWRRS